MNAIIVEDDRLIAEFIAYVLESEGLSAVIYHSGEDVVYPVIARIAVIDLVLPGVSGLNVAERIRAENDAIPIVFATGTTDAYNVRLMLRYTDYIINKPFTQSTITELRRTINAIKVQN